MRKIKLLAVLLPAVLLSGCAGSGKEKVHIYASPEIRAADGQVFALPLGGVYPLDESRISRAGAEAVCAAAQTEYSMDALNSLRFGENVFGAGLASVVYFGKYAANLTETEWQTLAKIAASPAQYAPALTGSPVTGISPQAQYASRIPANAYFDAMTEQIVTDLTAAKGIPREEAFALLYTEGVTVETPFQPAVQDAVDAVYSDNSSFAEGTNAFPQSACAVTDLSGNVAALAAGNHGNTAYNRAFRTLHSIGSSVKPLSVYTPALAQHRISFSSIVKDEPLRNAGQPDAYPQNFNGIYDGDITVTYALRQSKNTVPAALCEELGGDACLQYLRDTLHFSTLTAQDNEATAMVYGKFIRGVSMTELAAAYQIYGNGGVYHTPRLYTRVTGRDGKVVLEKADETVQAAAPADAWIMNRLLYYNVAKDDGIAAAARLDDGSEVCGKTGTVGNGIDSDTDRLFVGLTPEYCAAVWVGYDAQNAAIDRMEYRVPGEIWKRIMERLPRTKTAFTAEDSVIEAEYCTKSGMLAGAHCPGKELGYYRADELPGQCTRHG